MFMREYQISWRPPTQGNGNGAGHSLLADRMEAELWPNIAQWYTGVTLGSLGTLGQTGLTLELEAFNRRLASKHGQTRSGCRAGSGCPDGMPERRWVVLGRNRVAWDDRQRFETCRVEQNWVCLAISISQRPAVDRWTMERWTDP